MQHEINKCCKIGNVRLFLTGSSPVIRIFMKILYSLVLAKNVVFSMVSAISN
jgi:hypothetical protein